jgi:hypothetical protein
MFEHNVERCSDGVVGRLYFIGNIGCGAHIQVAGADIALSSYDGDFATHFLLGVWLVGVPADFGSIFTLSVGADTLKKSGIIAATAGSNADLSNLIFTHQAGSILLRIFVIFADNVHHTVICPREFHCLRTDFFNLLMNTHTIGLNTLYNVVIITVIEFVLFGVKADVYVDFFS